LAVKDAVMFALEKRDVRSSEISEAASRDEIGATFRSAMVGHFRSHVPGIDLNVSNADRKRLSQSLPQARHSARSCFL
jgi:hypothetical protein